MKKLILFICLCFSFSLYSQDQASHKIKVEVDINSFMCPNLGMKIKRTMLQRKNEISGFKVAPDDASAEFFTPNSLIANKDTILKIFVKESEFPFHIIRSIQIDDNEVYRKGNTSK